MSCSNCFNGCPEIISDQCVKYTGVDVPVLGIKTGDSLSYVEQALITFLTSTLDGQGIKVNIEPSIICPLVQGYLVQCEDLNVDNLFETLIKVACDLQEQIDAVAAEVAAINASYTVDCLTGVTGSSKTHDVVQAIIFKLCQLEVDLTALAINVDTNYVKLADLNTLIAAYLASTAPSNQYYNRMLPYTVVEYYGPLSNFDLSGKGIAALGWDKIYLCNGSNGTPDKRGRVGVGAIAGIPGGALDPEVDPGVSTFNPNYSLITKAGLNSITLNATQIPAHTHGATATVSPNPHNHLVVGTADDASLNSGNYITVSNSTGGNLGYALSGSTTAPSLALTSDTSLTVSVTNALTGGSLAHANNQPAIACYYVMYIP